MKNIKTMSLILFCLLSLFSFVDLVSATDKEDTLGYTVNLVEPNTQIDSTKNYFYVKTISGEPQTLEVRIKSTKKEAVNIKIYGVNAITSDGGTIEYSEDKSLYDETLKDSITSMIKIETPEITVSNYEEKLVKIKLTPPKEKYDGVKMGAIVFTLNQEKQEKYGVSTEFAYRVGLIASQSGDEFNNSQTLNLNSVKASIKRGKKMILANLQNPEPKVLENVDIVATMIRKDTDEVVKIKNVENYTMAPNSMFDFEIDWGISDLSSGTYTLKLDATNSYQAWQLSKEFTITNQQAKKINNESVFKIVTPDWIKAFAIVLNVLTFVTVVFAFIRRKKWEQQWNKIKISKRKKKITKKRRKKLNRKEKDYV